MAGTSLYNPMRGFDRLEPFSREIEDMLRNFFLNGRQMTEMFKGLQEPNLPLMPLTSGRFPVDVTENETGYKVRAELPGFQKDEIKVSIDGGQVSISAESRKQAEQKSSDQVIMQECYSGKQYRVFTLPLPVDDAKAAAKYSDGVLELTLPRKSGSGTATLAIT